MKTITFPLFKLSLSFILVLLTIQSAMSQTSPFSENFNATTIGALPTGWSYSGNGGYGWVLVDTNEGIGNSKAALIRLHDTYSFEDTLLTPIIGPITANSTLKVNYKFIQAPAAGINTPGGPYVAGSFKLPFFGNYFIVNPQFNITVINTSTNVKTIISLTDSTNNVPSMMYSLYTHSLSSFVGQNIKIAFIADGISAGLSEFWMDNISVADTALTTGVKELGQTTTNVFPNPTQGDLTIDSKENLIITIYDVTGRIVYKENMTDSKHTIHLTNNPAGIYSVTLNGATTNKTYRIIKT